MPYRPLRGTPDVLFTAVGRRELLARAGDRVGPLLSEVARVYRRTLASSTRVVAVVGSFGKTTAARAAGATLAVPQRHVGLNSVAWVAFGLLRIRPGQRHAVIEVGISGPGQMRRRAETVRPDVVVVTSVGSEHHRSLGTLAVTRHEKAEMVRALPPSGLAVLNGDDPNVAWMASQTRARVVTFGFGEGNDVRAGEVRIEWPRGTRFVLSTPAGEREVHVRLIGRVMVAGVLAGVAVALHEGVPLDDVVDRVARLEAMRGRLQPVVLPGGVTLLRDDFKAPEETVDAALDVLAEIPARRRIVVLGDLDEPRPPQRQTYRRLGRRVAQSAEQLVLVSRSDRGSALAGGAREGGLPAASVVRARGIREAVARLADLGAGDVVLIKGRHTQRLERIVLALEGREVRCDLEYCNARLVYCGRCPMLARPWAGIWAPGPRAGA